MPRLAMAAWVVRWGRPSFFSSIGTTRSNSGIAFSSLPPSR